MLSRYLASGYCAYYADSANPQSLLKQCANFQDEKIDFFAEKQPFILPVSNFHLTFFDFPLLPFFSDAIKQAVHASRDLNLRMQRTTGLGRGCFQGVKSIVYVREKKEEEEYADIQQRLICFPIFHLFILRKTMRRVYFSRLYAWESQCEGDETFYKKYPYRTHFYRLSQKNMYFSVEKEQRQNSTKKENYFFLAIRYILLLHMEWVLPASSKKR